MVVEPKTNTTRPDADSKLEVRCPRVLRQIVNDAATVRGISVTEVVLNALELEFSRFMIYGEDFYEKWVPMIVRQQQRRLSHKRVVPHR